MNYFLKLRESKYLNQSLSYYGILIQNHLHNLVKRLYVKPLLNFIILTEGYICSPRLNNLVRNSENIIIKKNEEIIIEKITNSKDIKIINITTEEIFDLYNTEENKKIYDIVNYWNTTEKIYISNTEEIPLIPKSSSIVGLASGDGLARLAHCSNSSKIIFFDYKIYSLEFQKKLIESNNRKKIFEEYLNFLTLGDKDATIDDIEKINFKNLDVLYNNLKDKEVHFLEIDFRRKSDILKLFNYIDRNSIIWTSNIMHYITSIDYYDKTRYNLLDKLCQNKQITILPETRIYYEG
jgi:hypothetical protein